MRREEIYQMGRLVFILLVSTKSDKVPVVSLSLTMSIKVCVEYQNQK